MGVGGCLPRRVKNTRRREVQQEFTHPWMAGRDLKGHTAPVLDMDFSCNGKFLATCAQDCHQPQPGKLLGFTYYPLHYPVGVAGQPVPGFVDYYNYPMGKDATAVRTCGIAEVKTCYEYSMMENAARGAADLAREDIKANYKNFAEEDGKTGSNIPANDNQFQTNDASSTTIEDSHSFKHSDAVFNDEKSNIQIEGQNHLLQPELLKRQFIKFPLHLQPTYPDMSMISNQIRFANTHEMVLDLDKELMENRQICLTAKSTVKGESIHYQPMNKYFRGRCLNIVSQFDLRIAKKYSKNIITEKKTHEYGTKGSLARSMLKYILTPEQLTHHGYPIECSIIGGAFILNQQFPFRTRRNHLDANATEFVPGSSKPVTIVPENEPDSGHCSGGSLENSDQESSSDSDKGSDSGESSPSLEKNHERDSVHNGNAVYVIERRCARCQKDFKVNRDTGDYLEEDSCVYHWGKLHSYAPRDQNCMYYECCRGKENSRGCSISKCHVWTGLVPGYNGPYSDFISTKPCPYASIDGYHGIYALDCEMSFTKRGLDLTKISVVDVDGNIIYDTYVKPDVEIIDYNTRFSGITAEHMNGRTKSLAQVQRDLLKFIYDDTILVGHGLENDLRALKILHRNVVDTCVAYPHFRGFPYRFGLKTLAKKLLSRDIQAKGHDSAEDAKAAIDLMLKKVMDDAKNEEKMSSSSSSSSSSS
ncbi:uncharacterized protein [Prorops nasuta]